MISNLRPWTVVTWEIMKNFLDSRGLSAQYIDDGKCYYIKAADGFFELETAISKDDSELSERTDFETNYKPYANISPITHASISSTPPFAEPTYRTKRNATSSIVTVVPDSSGDIDFQLTTERYISGGTLLAENAVFGDYAVATIYDKDSVIPEGYRATLCENWPVVATYIEKEWIKVNSSGLTCHEIDTAPLTAKVTPGLYLRITYHAVNSGSNRNIAVNYALTKKL